MTPDGTVIFKKATHVGDDGTRWQPDPTKGKFMSDSHMVDWYYAQKNGTTIDQERKKGFDDLYPKVIPRERHTQQASNT